MHVFSLSLSIRNNPDVQEAVIKLSVDVRKEMNEQLLTERFPLVTMSSEVRVSEVTVVLCNVVEDVNEA